MSTTEIEDDVAFKAQSWPIEEDENEMDPQPPRLSHKQSFEGDNYVESELKKDIEAAISSRVDESGQKESCEESKLYRAAVYGDWQTAKSIYDSDPRYMKATLSKLKETALHVAVAAGRNDFIKNLLTRLAAKGLAAEVLPLKDYFGQTALSLAAASGNLDLVQLMTKDNKHLALEENVDKYLPIHAGAMSGHKEVVLYLYSITEGQLSNGYLIELLIILIKTDLYDVALKLFEDHPELATRRDSNRETALHALAGKSIKSSYLVNQNRQGMLQRIFSHWVNQNRQQIENFFSLCNVDSTKLAVSRRNCDLSTKLPQQALTLVEIIWKEVIRSEDAEISTLIREPFPLIFVAAKEGNIEFLRLVIRKYPLVIWETDGEGRTIFHIAVLDRQVKILELINEMGSMKDRIVSRRDYGGNNMLHLAGMLPSNERPNVVFGTVLQLRQEVFWFKKVSQIVRPVDAEARNNSLETPRELFIRKHRSLMEDGQKWIRETADSCMVVATLVAAVVFAAAFTIPGGNKGDSGVPIFIDEASFTVFAISDAAALVCSTISILTFLTIRSSVYSEKDFLWLVPARLTFGIASLFVAIGAMMVVFCATFFTVFHGRLPWLLVLVAVYSSAPVLMFIDQYFNFFAIALGMNFKINAPPVLQHIYLTVKFSVANVGSTKLAVSHRNCDLSTKLPQQALTLVEIIWKEVIRLEDAEISTLIREPFPLIFVAAKEGNIEFLRLLIREYPLVVWETDEQAHTIFHIAVLGRHVKILELINEWGSMKDRIVSRRDNDGNNILHLAGMLPSNERSNIVFGTVLQPRQEEFWFKKVSQIVRPVDAEARNSSLEMPRELFIRKHRSLMEDGQKWIRETADSCMVVATLVAAVVFAAAFTIPGGNKGDSGVPIFIDEASFTVFAISDAAALVCSTISILTFLTIRSSVYSEKDFLWLVPARLTFGIASLFVAIGAMMVVFCATFFTEDCHGFLFLLPCILLLQSCCSLTNM